VGIGLPYLHSLPRLTALAAKEWNGMDGSTDDVGLLAWCWMSSSVVVPSPGCPTVCHWTKGLSPK
jgi:hypothetical protein